MEKTMERKKKKKKKKTQLLLKCDWLIKQLAPITEWLLESNLQ
jgi:hypothetical protein